MPYFTDSPYERMMTKRPKPTKETILKKESKDDIRSPCFSCTYNKKPCIGYCIKELMKGGG